MNVIGHEDPSVKSGVRSRNKAKLLLAYSNGQILKN